MKKAMSWGASSIRDQATTVIIEERTAFYFVSLLVEGRKWGGGRTGR